MHSSLSPTNIYLFKINYRNTWTRCEICSKLTIETSERRYWRRSGVFIVNFEYISHLSLVFFVVDFEQTNISWVSCPDLTCATLTCLDLQYLRSHVILQERLIWFRCDSYSNNTSRPNFIICQNFWPGVLLISSQTISW